MPSGGCKRNIVVRMGELRFCFTGLSKMHRSCTFPIALAGLFWLMHCSLLTLSSLTLLVVVCHGFFHELHLHLACNLHWNSIQMAFLQRSQNIRTELLDKKKGGLKNSHRYGSSRCCCSMVELGCDLETLAACGSISTVIVVLVVSSMYVCVCLASSSRNWRESRDVDRRGNSDYDNTRYRYNSDESGGSGGVRRIELRRPRPPANTALDEDSTQGSSYSSGSRNSCSRPGMEMVLGE